MTVIGRRSTMRPETTVGRRERWISILAGSSAGVIPPRLLPVMAKKDGCQLDLQTFSHSVVIQYITSILQSEKSRFPPITVIVSDCRFIFGIGRYSCAPVASRRAWTKTSFAFLNDAASE